jgi:hypothetical protein
MDNAARLAGVVELVDAPDSKSGVRDDVRVRVPPPAPLSALKKFKGTSKNPHFIPTDGTTSHSTDETPSHSTRLSKNDNLVAGYKSPKNGNQVAGYAALRKKFLAYI